MPVENLPEIDESVRRAALDGDQAAIGRLLTAIEPVLAKTTTIEFKSRPICSREDVVSELKMHVLARLDAYDPEKASLSTWVRTLAKNYIASKQRFLRAAKRGDSTVDFSSLASWGQAPALVGWLASQLPPPDRQLREDDRNAAIGVAILSLNETERDVIVRRYYQNQSTDEIAAALGRTPKAVENFLMRTRLKLLTYLGSASRYRISES